MSEDFISYGKSIERLEKDAKRNEFLFIALVVVLFIGFMGIGVTLGIELVNANRGSEASYQDLVDKVDNQTYQITILRMEMTKRGY